MDSSNTDGAPFQLVFDCEGVSDGLKGNGSLAYDFGWVVVNRAGVEMEGCNYVCSEVFSDADRMKNGYYADKLPAYWQALRDDASGMKYDTLLGIRQAFRETCERWDIHEVWAYNAQYDRATTNNTTKQISRGFACYFTPRGVKWRDMWPYAGATVCNTRKFVKWCEEHHELTSSGFPSTTAQTVFRYISGAPEFMEDHTALSDARIEAGILLACDRRKQKKPDPEKFGGGGKYARAIAQAMRAERKDS